MKIAMIVLAAGLLGSAGVQAESSAPADPCAGAGTAAAGPASVAPRRRIYLVRHGEANYVGADGQRVPNLDLAGLSERGIEQSRATGRWFCSMGVRNFDVVVSSPLARAQQTTATVLETMHLPASRARIVDGLREQDPDHESVAEARARILPALERLRGEPWNTALIVAHSLVDKIILSEILTGTDALYGRIEQGNGCINIIDVGEGPQDWILRAANVCPTEGGTRY